MLLFLRKHNKIVIPAKAGIQCIWVFRDAQEVWIPAYAGMTVTGSKRLLNDCVLQIFIVPTLEHRNNHFCSGRSAKAIRCAS